MQRYPMHVRARSSGTASPHLEYLHNGEQPRARGRFAGRARGAGCSNVELNRLEGGGLTLPNARHGRGAMMIIIVPNGAFRTPLVSGILDLTSN